MANLAQTAVKVKSSRYVPFSGRKMVEREFELTLTGQGTTVDGERITADSLNLRKIERASVAVATDNSIIVVATPSYDGAYLLLKAAATNAPATFTGVTLRVFVGGQS